MASSYIDYMTSETPRADAIRDIREWLGADRFEALDAEFRRYDAESMPLERFQQFLSIAGIGGFPVSVWWENLYGGNAIGYGLRKAPEVDDGNDAGGTPV